ncbi:hypothetical protein KAR91_22430, partial [Candidatus Pacearchaeota archaeon]|nr:hypothetical protein [Candidatus Pacearchaeota archaeon]
SGGGDGGGDDGGGGGGGGGGCTTIPEEPTLSVDWSRPTTDTPPMNTNDITKTEAAIKDLFTVLAPPSVRTRLIVSDLI